MRENHGLSVFLVEYWILNQKKEFDGVMLNIDSEIFL